MRAPAAAGENERAKWGGRGDGPRTAMQAGPKGQKGLDVVEDERRRGLQSGLWRSSKNEGVCGASQQVFMGPDIGKRQEDKNDGGVGAATQRTRGAAEQRAQDGWWVLKLAAGVVVVGGGVREEACM